MEMKRKVRIIVIGICIMLLIVDSKCAIEGARNGIALCVATVFPSLFPFFVLSMLLTKEVSQSNNRTGRMLVGALGIPGTAVPVLVPAFLGGYPVGAKSVADQYHRKRISRKEAERLLGFCSNAGPSFLFGMVSGFFPDRKAVWGLWLIHIMGAVFASSLFPAEPVKANCDDRDTASVKREDIMLPALKAAATVCGWVVLFRVVVTFLDRWVLWLLPHWLRVLVIGLLELSNGCCELNRVQNVGLRFILCSAMLSAGGVCVYLQTASVTGGLSLRNYLIGKGLQTAFSCLVSYLVVSGSIPVTAAGITVLALIFLRSKNRGRNPLTFPV